MASDGLFKKFNVTKADGSPTDPKARYFVLRLDDDEAARSAALEYIRWIWENEAEETPAQAPVLPYDLMQELMGQDHEIWMQCPACCGHHEVWVYDNEDISDDAGGYVPCPVCQERPGG